MHRTKIKLGLTWPLRGLIAAVALSAVFPALAGVTYRLDRASAAPGDTVRIEAVYFNDGESGSTWEPSEKMVVQWRGADGKIVRSLATRPGGKSNLNVPADNFARLSWDAVVPVQANGLQAVSIEGQPSMMALDATGRETGTLASKPAYGPVVDARTGKPVPAVEVAAAGASTEGGPAPAEWTDSGAAEDAAFNEFRSALSAYKPVYFSVDTRNDTTARFQISAKYRLFRSPEKRPPTFGEKFYMGYTQTSLWDLHGHSKPFIDTTYNPSLFWYSEKMWESDNKNWYVGLNTGVEHASNGRDGEESRSLNDAYVQPSFNYRFDSGSTLSFSPKIKSYFMVEEYTSGYSKYAGHVDWNLRWAQDDGAVVSAMYRQGDSQRRTTQLDFAWPLRRTFLNMNGYLHLQYFNGYGETLLYYNKRGDTQFRIGLALVP